MQEWKASQANGQSLVNRHARTRDLTMYNKCINIQKHRCAERIVSLKELNMNIYHLIGYAKYPSVVLLSFIFSCNVTLGVLMFEWV